MDLRKLRGMKGCKKCPGILDGLAKALEETAYNRHEMGEKDWERAYERAVGVRLALGILKNGVGKDGDVVAHLPCPPNVKMEDWKNGPRFIRGVGFNDRSEDVLKKPEALPTNPEGKPPVKPIVPGPAKKKKERKQGTARKGGFEVLSLKDLKKKRGL